MKSYPPEPSGITLLTAPEGSPDETVSLIRSEGFKFLAGINYNTSIYNYQIYEHHLYEHHYYMLIACKELHWPKPSGRTNDVKQSHLKFFVCYVADCILGCVVGCFAGVVFIATFTSSTIQSMRHINDHSQSYEH